MLRPEEKRVKIWEKEEVGDRGRKGFLLQYSHLDMPGTHYMIKVSLVQFKSYSFEILITKVRISTYENLVSFDEPLRFALETS